MGAAGIEEQKTEVAIAEDICTPPQNYSPTDGTAQVEPLVLLTSSQNVMSGAREWGITLRNYDFSVYVNAGKVVAAPKRHKWMVGKPWGLKVKPWLLKNGAHGAPKAELAPLPGISVDEYEARKTERVNTGGEEMADPIVRGERVTAAAKSTTSFSGKVTPEDPTTIARETAAAQAAAAEVAEIKRLKRNAQARARRANKKGA